jgi:hypothetical protein
MKIVINRDYGGFSLSDEAFERYLNLKGIEFDLVENNEYKIVTKLYYRKGSRTDKAFLWDHDIERNDSILVQVVEEMGETANGSCASLKVVEVPEDVEWEIAEYDGLEWVAEKHRRWS